MKYFFPQKRLSQDAQHIIEYIVLITIAAIAVIIIGPYVVRSWNASVKSWDDSVVDTFNDPLLDTNELVPVLDCPSAIACPTAQLDIGSGLIGKYDRACPGEVRNPGCPSLYEGNPERKCQLGPTGSDWVKTDKYDDCTPIGCAYTCGLNIGAGLTGCFGPANHGETDTISECGVGYVGSPTYTCNFGSWVNLQNPCVVTCGNGTCEPTEGENCVTCPGDCPCPPGAICFSNGTCGCPPGTIYVPPSCPAGTCDNTGCPPGTCWDGN